jgi:HSP20 family protein
MRTQFAGMPTEMINSLIDEVFNTKSNISNRLAQPPVNIFKNSKNYIIQVLAPGAKKEDLNITIKEGVLIISHSKKEEIKAEGELIRNEFNINNFERKFKLNDQIDNENIDATYQDGILEVVLPLKISISNPNLNITIK